MIIRLFPFVRWMVKKYLQVGTAFQSHSCWMLKYRYYHNHKNTPHTINYNARVHSCTLIEKIKHRNLLHLSQCLLYVKLGKKNPLSFSGNAVVVSPICSTHAPIIHQCFECCGCNRIYDASLQQQVRVGPVLPPCLPLGCGQTKWHMTVTAAVLIPPLTHLWCVPASYTDRRSCSCDVFPGVLHLERSCLSLWVSLYDASVT